MVVRGRPVAPYRDLSSANHSRLKVINNTEYDLQQFGDIVKATVSPFFMPGYRAW